jgi:predicted DNA-binding transcriptional regulator YafY
VRADRLVSLVLLLQARGRTTAVALAEELEVSVRTIYRDLEALGAVGVPVRTESGPGGGCQLLDGYRFPLRGLRPEEAEALLILGVPGAVRELGLDAALTAAQRQIRVTAGLTGQGGPGAALVHLDLPRWFRGREEVPHLRSLARALRLGRHLAIRYQREPEALCRGNGEAGGAPEASWKHSDPDPRPGPGRVVGPLGLVDKAGTWYLVASTRNGEGRGGGWEVGGWDVTVFRAGRITSARVLAEPFARPAEFRLAEFWERWSREFAATRPRVPVRLRASPEALAAFPEIFGEDVTPALDAALPPDARGWRVVTLSFEHEAAAAHRLAGFGGRVEVLSPVSVRDQLLATAREILGRYGAARVNLRAAARLVTLWIYVHMVRR